jgi:hypothetical protein
LIVLDRARDEAHARARLTSKQQAPAAHDAMAEETRRAVQKDNVEAVAANHPSEVVEQSGELGAGAHVRFF